ncbi:hypothetical protein STSP2_03285 [Anaerohalosphaera lusitana]|uniref:Uncharacterized protein n=1 Tax=Anaerohalosphaera lusitana TaxID=1936003 RepID=A0A1U9NQ72_9BACT|nr:PEP-CTERM sorting domain-containing protein [Anaerohalosphaera lusitana]AQT70083.1 hypothetical protein STSP2_03285 [Anaerohalosphaera lusitana]
MKSKAAVILFCVFAVLIADNAVGGVWTELKWDEPLYSAGTFNPTAIYGDTIVGTYIPKDGHGSQGFVYDGNEFKKLSKPGAYSTKPYGVYDNLIVGAYNDSGSSYNYQGFVYDGESFTTLNNPHTTTTLLKAIDGDRMLASDTSTVTNDYMFDNFSWEEFEIDGAAPYTVKALDLDGDTIVGRYKDENGTNHYYVRTGDTLEILEKPGASSIHGAAVDNGLIVGTFSDDSGSHGFIYDGTSWITVDKPGAYNTSFSAIHGDTIVGRYSELNGYQYDQGVFIYTIPEPATLALLTTGLLLMRRNRAIN